MPLGLDVRQPRLSWRVETHGRAYAQEAYRIYVATRPELLEDDQGDLWDSDVVCSSHSVDIVYAGKAMCSRQRCYWKVRVWGVDGTQQDSPITQWELGLLESEDWEAEWIGYPAGVDGGALYFRREFDLFARVKSARVYVCGLGYHELSINGSKIGDHVLDPAWTAYDKRVLYCVHDLGFHLRSGRNVIGVMVGNGWYGMPKLRLQLELEYEDGRREKVSSRGGHTDAPNAWFVGSGPLRGNNIYGGEFYDATLEQEHWNLAETDESSVGQEKESLDFAVAVRVDAPSGRMQFQALEPIRVMERFAPLYIEEVESGCYVFDAGRNLAGWGALLVRGRRGQRITLRYTENLGSDGKIDRGTLRKALAEDTYILKGEGVETWEPRFTYHGFRYIQVEGLPEAPTPETLTICVVRSDVAKRGDFQCENALINQIEEAVIRTEESNLHGVPTDCPQRDERLGWLNDMTVRAEEAVYHFGMERFFDKWYMDVVDTQCPLTGSITDTAPFTWGKRPADPVSASFLLIPWLSYLHYGSDRLIRDYYPCMVRWVEFLISQCHDGILLYSNWGDWAPPEAFADKESVGGGAVAKYTPGALVSTAFLAYQTQLLSRMANVLGDQDGAHRWDQYSEEIRSSFHDRFWDESLSCYGSGNQACNTLALSMKLVPDDLHDKVLEHLLANIAKHQNHLTVGNLCTKYLFEVLSEAGHVDLAFQIATQTTYPSWGYMLAHGATTLWERWEYQVDGEMNSHNHPMLGSISAWFFKYLAGIRSDEMSPGFKHFIIKPYPPAALGGLHATYECPYGEISVEWKQSGGCFDLELVVPDNTQATIYIPAMSQDAPCEATQRHEYGTKPDFIEFRDGRMTYRAGPGKYRFHSRLFIDDAHSDPSLADCPA